MINLYVVGLFFVGVVLAEIHNQLVVLRIMPLSSSVSTVFWSGCTSPSSGASGFSSSIISIVWEPPDIRFALCVNSASIPAISSRLQLFGLDGANMFLCDCGSYLLRMVPGLAEISLLSTSLLVFGLLLLLRIISIISQEAP